ncbi:hypothetical protein MYSTI_03245 [Myxococcus stipitatus DSM 14675]|uniref:Holliday junction resolvase RuvC n=1 Tax=Myxococcus stipitatus (strain DSM 14675 / JCM 12634 / Mx s8) TaxID=1278073 RepID=L7UAD7_MYXSD|nr:hypothetical protein [Myxococcus stipitatus]AGC44557.1 hypothetical protein MYSTI_03245 [Myxococcus stipitatus DSM 14675]
MSTCPRPEGPSEHRAAKLVSIDPGLRHCGVALFDVPGGGSATLLAAGLPKNPEPQGGELSPSSWASMALAVRGWLQPRLGDESYQLIIEMPRVYAAAHQKGDQNDLIQLSGVVGMLGGYLPNVATRRSVHPRDWKGTLDADAFIERIKQRLDASEHLRVELPSSSALHHNVWDAIGIGLHALGRLTPRKVFPR